MKIVLFALNGSYSHTCLAVRCLRPHLEAEGFDVAILERSLKDRDAHILKTLYDEDADIYAFSTYIWNARTMLSLAEKLKLIKPRAVCIFGGPEVSYETERYVDSDGEYFKYMDFIVSGEGEVALARLCRAIRDEGLDNARKKFGRVVRYSDLPNEDKNSFKAMETEGILYRRDDKNAALFYYESSRGCPYSCAYCLSSAMEGVRAKDVDTVISDLRAFEDFSEECRVVKFVDRTFNFDVHRANRIWEALLSPEFTLKYHFEVCVSLLNEESYEILSRFPKGKIQLEIGLQSTNPQTLGEVSRHISPEAVISATARLKEMGNIPVYLDLIAGLPYEGIDSFAHSFDSAYFAADRLQVGFLKLLPGTRLRRDAEKYGYRYDPEPPYTVLESSWIGYSKLERIHSIHELLERFCESGHFVRALNYCMPSVESPFGFWNGFASYLAEKDSRVLQKISQPDAYRYFGGYIRDVVSKENEKIDADAVSSCLRADFEEAEHKKAPSGI